MNSAEPDAELILQAIAGDRGAVLKLLGRFRRELCAQVQNRIPATLRGSVDAEDVVQEAHVEVIRSIGTFEPRAAGSFQRWVRTIATRKLRDAARRHRAAKRGAGVAPATNLPRGVADSMVALLDLVAGPERTPSRVVARTEAVQAMQAAMEQLPESYRRVLWLIHIQERSVAEAAADMGRSEGAIRVLCHKARRRLAEILGSRSRFLSSSG